MKNYELDWSELLKSISSLAQSERAKALCMLLEAQPSLKEAEAAARLALLAQVAIYEQDLPRLSFLDHTNLPFERLQVRASLDVKELIFVRQFLNGATSIKELLKLTKNAFTEKVASQIADFKSQLSAINHVLAPDGEINEDASQTLASLCDEKRKLSREISRTLDQIVLRRQMESVLQDRYVTNREGRMVIPVKSGNQHDVKGLIHDASQSKQTVFMEPEEVIPMNNRLRQVQILIQDEIARILKELSDYLARFLTAFRNADQALLDCDFNFAVARFNEKSKAPLFISQRKISLH